MSYAGSPHLDPIARPQAQGPTCHRNEIWTARRETFSVPLGSMRPEQGSEDRTQSRHSLTR